MALKSLQISDLVFILLNSTLDIVDLSFDCMNGSLGYGIVIIFLWCMRSMLQDVVGRNVKSRGLNLTLWCETYEKGISTMYIRGDLHVTNKFWSGEISVYVYACVYIVYDGKLTRFRLSNRCVFVVQTFIFLTWQTKVIRASSAYNYSYSACVRRIATETIQLLTKRLQMLCKP